MGFFHEGQIAWIGNRLDCALPGEAASPETDAGSQTHRVAEQEVFSSVCPQGGAKLESWQLDARAFNAPEILQDVALDP
jgi:hypothetical protein